MAADTGLSNPGRQAVSRAAGSAAAQSGYMDEQHGHNHHHNHPPHNRPDGPGRPSVAASFANLRGSGLSWRRCLAAVAANNWRKIRRRQNCCGHLGQPGC